MSKRRRRGKRKYTVSEAALAQRRKNARGAAWKNGTKAKGALAQAIPPCNRRLCPMSEESGEKGNCTMKRAVEANGQTVELCPVHLVVDEGVRRKVIAAIQKGETDGMAELTGTLLAGMHKLSAQELGKVLDEGLSVDFEMPIGEGQSVLSTKTNPRAEPLLKLLTMVGATAEQQAITPKAAGERKRDEGVGGLLEMYRRRAALAGARAGGE